MKSLPIAVVRRIHGKREASPSAVLSPSFPAPRARGNDGERRAREEWCRWLLESFNQNPSLPQAAEKLKKIFKLSYSSRNFPLKLFMRPFSTRLIVPMDL